MSVSSSASRAGRTLWSGFAAISGVILGGATALLLVTGLLALLQLSSVVGWSIAAAVVAVLFLIGDFLISTALIVGVLAILFVPGADAALASLVSFSDAATSQTGFWRNLLIAGTLGTSMLTAFYFVVSARRARAKTPQTMLGPTARTSFGYWTIAGASAIAALPAFGLLAGAKAAHEGMIPDISFPDLMPFIASSPYVIAALLGAGGVIAVAAELARGPSGNQ